MSNQGQGDFEALTEREQEILLCLAEGLSNQEIARRLYLADNTVRWYNSQIYSKLGVSNRSSALGQAQAFGLLDTATAATPSPQTRHNLPAQTTPFIGRQQELVEIADLLADLDLRLLTILAPGGMGKTRLALAAAEGQLRQFADGVFFVPLAPLSSPDNIVTAIAENIGFSFYGGNPPKQQLLDYFRERNVLLVLDNFEHLLEGAPLVSDILWAAPQVKVLATSREKLNLSGESVFALSGLHFPTWETPEDALEYDAAKLFMQSAHRVRPNFELQTDDLDYLTRICRLTGGMPLGIVLAASWADVLSLEQIAAEIQGGIDILETELRDVPERQRSVRATFNYSWERLAELEQHVYMKLSVFRGGFTPDAAGAVAGANLRQLRKLVDRALVQALPTGRHEVHELLRQYTEEKLTEASEADAVYNTHCRYYLDYLRQREPDIKGRKQLEILDTIDDDHENIYAAWRWGVAHDLAEAVSQAVETLSVFVHSRGSHQIEAALLFRRAHEDFSAERNPRAWARVTLRYTLLMKRGLFFSELSFYDEIERCLAIAEVHGDLGEIALCKKQLASHDYVYETRIDDHAVRLIHEALTHYEALGDSYGVSNVLKWIAILTEDKEASLEYYDKSIAIAREAGILSLVPSTLFEVGQTYLILGRFTDAENAFQEAISLFATLDDPYLHSSMLCWLGLVKFFTGKFSEARELHKEAARIGDRFGFPAAKSRRVAALALLDTIEQETYLEPQVWPEKVIARSNWPLPLMLTVKMVQSYRLGDYQIAWSTAIRCLRGRERSNYPQFKIATLTTIAMLLADEGEYLRAVELLSLAFSHPASPRGWLENWPLLIRKREQVQAQLDSEAHNAAWGRGKSFDLESVIAELLAEFADAEEK